MLIHSLMGLPAFAAYFATAIALCVLYLFVYMRVTPHDEYELIIHEHNASAALALGMSLLGFVIPLSSAILHSVKIFDCIVWGLVALAFRSSLIIWRGSRIQIFQTRSGITHWQVLYGLVRSRSRPDF